MICATCHQPHPGHGSRCAACLLNPRPETGRTAKKARTGRRRAGIPRLGGRAVAPYQAGSQTSIAAAAAVTPYVPTQRDIIVSWVAEHGPATNSEIAGMTINVVSARVNSELYPYNDRARLEDAGHRACRVTGHEARVVRVRT